MSLTAGYNRNAAKALNGAFNFAADSKGFKQKGAFEASLTSNQTTASKVLGKKAPDVSVSNVSAKTAPTAKTAPEAATKAAGNKQNADSKKGAFKETLETAQKQLGEVIKKSADNTGMERGKAMEVLAPAMPATDLERLAGLGLSGGSGVNEFASAAIEAITDIRKQSRTANVDPKAVIAEMKTLLTPKRDEEGGFVAPAPIQSDFDFENGFDWDDPRVEEQIREFMKPAEMHKEFQQLDDASKLSAKDEGDAVTVDKNKYADTEALFELSEIGDKGAMECLIQSGTLCDIGGTLNVPGVDPLKSEEMELLEARFNPPREVIDFSKPPVGLSA